MKKPMEKFVITLLICSCAALTAHAAAKSRYVITITRERPAILAVSATVTPANGIVSMAENGATQFDTRWAHFVRNLTAVDSHNNKITLEPLSDAKWRVAARGPITLNYEVLIEHEKHTWDGGIDGIAFVRDGGIFATGRTFLITGDRNVKNIFVEFNLKGIDRVTASWKPVRKSRTRYTARNITDLEQSMFLAGKHDEFVVERDGFELVFAVAGDELKARAAKFRDLATGVLDHYIALMGGIPKPPPSNRFERSIAIINAGKDLDGEVIGNHISMILNPAGDAQSEVFGKFIFAHEFFHLWNGKSINVADTTEDWFKEGVTSYYTLKTLHSLGEISEAEVFGLFENLFYKRYVDDQGFGRASMRDVAGPGMKDKHWGLIYGGGMFAGICQDVAMRRATKNKRSLDDVMRLFYRTIAGTTKTYTTADLERAIEKIAASDQSEFFKQYVYGTAAVPIEKCLQDAGFNASVANGSLKISRRSTVGQQSYDLMSDIIGIRQNPK